jgi:hypothetical protein
MLKRFVDYVEGLSPRTMLVLNLAYAGIAIASNSVIAYSIWRAYDALYALSSGWSAFGLVWAFLAGFATILTNIAKMAFRVPSSFTQYNEETVRARDYSFAGKHRVFAK